MRKQRSFKLDTGEEITARQAELDERNIHRIGQTSLRLRLYSGVTDPDELFAEPKNKPHVFTLSTGEQLTVREAQVDDRNVHEVSLMTLRHRLLRQDGITPEALWAKPNNVRSEPTQRRLTTGEVMTPLEAVQDPRNVHGITLSGLRSRMERGLLSPAQLWGRQRTWTGGRDD